MFYIASNPSSKCINLPFYSGGVHKPVGIFRVNRETEFTGRVKDLSLDSFIFLGRSNLSDGLWRFITPAEDFCWKGNNCKNVTQRLFMRPKKLICILVSKAVYKINMCLVKIVYVHLYFVNGFYVNVA